MQASIEKYTSTVDTHRVKPWVLCSKGRFHFMRGQWRKLTNFLHKQNMNKESFSVKGTDFPESITLHFFPDVAAHAVLQPHLRLHGSQLRRGPASFEPMCLLQPSQISWTTIHWLWLGVRRVWDAYTQSSRNGWIEPAHSELVLLRLIDRLSINARPLLCAFPPLACGLHPDTCSTTLDANSMDTDSTIEEVVKNIPRCALKAVVVPWYEQFSFAVADSAYSVLVVLVDNVVCSSSSPADGPYRPGLESPL